MKNWIKSTVIGLMVMLTTMFGVAQAKSYKINGISYHPISKSQSVGFTETGKATWYGGKFHGRKTASGARYNIHHLTAAHKTLPFGTKVKVTNKNNGKSVIVTINDRGPFKAGRVIDLSPKAFNVIGHVNSGVLNVKLEVLD